MARYKSLSDDFHIATIKLAQTWRSENVGWQDIKSRQFGERVMTPVSNECGKINELLTRMDHILSRMVEVKLIDEK